MISTCSSSLLTRDHRFVAVGIVLNAVPKTLSNGLRVLVLELPHLHAVSHALLLRTGPRYESEADNGISHLVEHLVFRGTIEHPDSYALNVAVEGLGGEINGLTQRDATTIHLTVPPRSAAPALMLLGEICTRPLLTGIEVERDVVMEELLDTLDATGAELDVDVLSRRVLWNGHGIGLPIAGTPSTVEALTEAECRAHFEKTFVAENAVLCVAGPVQVEEMFAVAERAFARMPRGTPLVEIAPPVPPVRAPIQVQAMDDSQVTAMLTYPAPHENHPDFAALLLLKRVLDDGLGSRLRQAVCEQRGLAYSLSASIDAYSDIGAIDVELACAPKKLVPAIEATLGTLQQLVRAPIGEAELERAKIRHRAELEFALDDPSEMCGWYGAMELVRCRASYEERLADVMKVSAADIQRLAQRILDPTLAILTLVGPAEESDTHRLELLLGREAQSTVWLNDGEIEEDEDELAAAS
jgi:predicted Zn-dependent peptidase